MKTYIIKTILTTSIIGLFMTSCNNSPTAKEEDVQEATQDLIDAEADLEQAEYDSISDFNTFDPESSSATGQYYPQQRIVNAGLTVTF